MAIPYVILLDLLIFWFFFGNQTAELFRTARGRIRHKLKIARKQLQNRLLRDRDILSPDQRDFLQLQIRKVAEVLAAGSPEQEKTFLTGLEGAEGCSRMPPPRKFPMLREWVEVAVVSVGIAFGVRALFLQPFKIPTGSMQVTLYGMHYEPENDMLPRGKIAEIFSYLNFSRRNAELTVREDGILQPNSVKPLPSFPLFPKSAVQIGNVIYSLPGTPQEVLYRLLGTQQNIVEHAQYGIPFRKGEKLLHGYLASGDHLFVNRLSLCFREPRRGDIMVFLTDGLQSPYGQPFGGRYYVKRLAGLPGDTLLIRDRKLYVREKGAADFRQLTGKDHPGFAKVQSCQNGYNGYLNMPGSLYLTDGQTSFTVPEGHYFMLGDNSANSLDSRYWGTVPRRNLVGCPGFVWWPFSSHFGFL